MHSDDRLPEAQLVHPGEKVDDLQRSGLRIIQDPARFCFGMDAVLLTGFIQEGIGGRSMAREDMLDLGTGTGIIPLLMSEKSDLRTLTGLEIQPDSADMAKRSVELNGISDRVRILQGDIREADTLFAPASFGIVTSNPPYMIGGHGLQNPYGAGDPEGQRTDGHEERRAQRDRGQSPDPARGYQRGRRNVCACFFCNCDL